MTLTLVLPNGAYVCTCMYGLNRSVHEDMNVISNVKVPGIILAKKRNGPFGQNTLESLLPIPLHYKKGPYLPEEGAFLK